MARDPGLALVVYNGRSADARGLAEQLARRLGTRLPACAADSLAPIAVGAPHQVPSVLVTVGGDGTLLRAAHVGAPAHVPLLGVNMGRLGFLTEVESADAVDLVPRYLGEEGYAWLEPRAMLQASVLAGAEETHAAVHGLNEVVVGHRTVAHLARLAVAVDGAQLTTYAADAVIIATATGSTAYALSAGGPIMYPVSRDMVLTAVASHGDLSAPVVLPQSAHVEVAVIGEYPASVSVDGAFEMPVAEGEVVHVRASPHVAQFLRAAAPAQFYETLVYRLRRGADQAQRIARLMSEREPRRRG